jgi:hypothetical protein
MKISDLTKLTFEKKSKNGSASVNLGMYLYEVHPPFEVHFLCTTDLIWSSWVR